MNIIYGFHSRPDCAVWQHPEQLNFRPISFKKSLCATLPRPSSGQPSWKSQNHPFFSLDKIC